MGYKTNILIIGPSNSGKDTVVNNVEWGETRIMVASYASVVLNNNKNYLFMLKGEDNYKSFDEILLFQDGQGPDGIIMVLDSSKGFKENDLDVVEMIISQEIPHVIFANKQDMGNQNLNNHFTNSLIVPTIANEGIGINDGFKLLLKSVNDDSELTNSKPLPKVKTEFKREEPSRINDNDMVAKMKDALIPSKNHGICRLKMSMHPVELENVMKVLENNGFANMTVIKNRLVQDVGSKEIYRGYKHEARMKMRTELIMTIRSDEVSYVVDAIKSIKTDDIDDYISIKPVEDVLRVRTLERGVNALD
ncbi:nitrogen regulatory protein P-II [Methanobacterium lacus]|uniref:Nitrogen regulatory protein P-II n=1 Tax=Methanobacterium lacus (strain AL-21) TaxID=877455 RepID=F0T629_METLA|nr:P-II family nitrogen regulator [Methanobacterium lacus]ADZ10536.1 nitrogen regulatory protein P-II [Methanobacterium lacus]